MPQGALPFQYAEEKGSTGMTALSGLATYLDLARVAGLSESARPLVFSYEFAACCNSDPLLAPLCVPFCISSRHPHSVCGECVGLFGRWSLIAPALEDLGHGWMAGGVIALWYALGGMGVGDRGSGLRDGGAGLAVCGQVAEVEGDCLGLGGH